MHKKVVSAEETLADEYIRSNNSFKAGIYTSDTKNSLTLS